MKITGILFQPDMVRAILDGRKTLTSRMIHPQPEEVGFGRNCIVKPYCTGTEWPLAYYEIRGSCWNSSQPLRCPYGGAGDRLIGRETWATSKECDDRKPNDMEKPGRGYGWPVWYMADGAINLRGRPSLEGGPGFTTKGKTRVSIHMPFWASRLHLEITRVWPSRLQDMTEEEAIAEGIEYTGDQIQDGKKVCGSVSVVGTYAALWDRINGAKPGRRWADNPWVWRIQFKKAAHEACERKEA